MKQVKKSVWLTASALIVAGNLYLTFKEDSKADRSQWLAEWNQSAKDDVVETFQTTGVITPADEYPVYFDKNEGTFLKFLVEKGQKVDAGTPLFEYSSSGIEQEIKELEAEKTQTEKQIQLIDGQISKLNSILNKLEREEKDRDNEKDTKKDSAAKVTVEKDIIDQETEKEKLEEEIRKYDTLISQAESKKSNLVVRSEKEGIVKKLNSELNNPIITIRSPEAAIQGVFNEQQMNRVKEGLAIHASVDPLPVTFHGEISSIERFPEQEPSVKRKSLYPFTAQLDKSNMDEAADQLLPGMKANVTVVTKEALQAVTVPASTLMKSGSKTYVFVLNKKGKIEKRTVKKGLAVDGIQEIKSGLKAGEKVVANPDELVIEKGAFITPADYTAIKKAPFQKLSKTERLKFLIMGILS
ncbi:efflux RND transporter periplasmic adaptor subunit [Pseudobacillus badius]|uniref:efflux RND transporter periplasmic adaptor subunit n=1 Tax=Bacillus badius TaxID=1455 RepID=UPI003CFB91D1